MVKIVNILCVTVFMLVMLLPGISVHAESTVPASLIFTEIKTRADSSSIHDVDEFIELYNASLVPLPLTNYVIEYFNSTNPDETQVPSQKAFSDKVLAPGGQLVLAKQPTKIINSIATPLSSLSDTGGRLRLVTTEGNIIDEIAWTNSQSMVTSVGINPSVVYQCNTSNALCNANRMQSFGRQQVEGLYVLDQALWQLGTMSPMSNELLPVLDEVQEEPAEPVEEPLLTDPPPQAPTCEGIVISELLPNADGADTSKEFIELHNPNAEPISLIGCSLQVSSSSKTFQFEDTILAPDAYVVFTDQDTGLTMPNTAGATVWLLTPQKELQAISYPGNLDENVSWATLGNIWQATYAPTRGYPNISLPDKPCKAGEERDVVTNDCEKIATAAVVSLTSCKAGQERNPYTNRCRNIITAAALVSCKVGQERNPETNRCRTVQAASTLLPCDEGEERNSETNRCRKVTDPTASKIAKVSDVTSPNTVSGSKLWLLIAGLGLVIGYAVYEWRQDLAQKCRNLISKLHR